MNLPPIDKNQSGHIPSASEQTEKVGKKKFGIVINWIKSKGSNLINKISRSSGRIKRTESGEGKKVKLSKKEKAQQDPSHLLNLSALGSEITGDQFLEAARQCKSNLSVQLNKNPAAGTTLHLLYDKAADAFVAEGDLEKAFQVRAELAEAVKMPKTHPLHDMNAILSQVAEQKKPSDRFGAHFSSLDTGILKGGNIKIFQRNIDGEDKDIMFFRMSQFARKDLQNNLDHIANNLDAFMDNLPENLRSQVKITEVPYFFKGPDKNGVFKDKKGFQPEDANAIEIEFKGIGKVIVGNSPHYGCLYNDVSVEIDSNLPNGEGVERMHQMLSVLGCGPILGAQRTEDDERLKIALVFRTFYPAEANTLERQNDFYELPVGELKNRIIDQQPEMKNIFKKYDKKNMMSKVEIYPGKTAWAMKDIGDQMRNNGAKGLWMGVGEGISFPEVSNMIASILQKGAISSQDRLEAGVIIQGASPKADLQKGGGDRVFTRLVNDNTDKHIKDHISKEYGYVEGPYYSGCVQILFDLDVLNRGGYAYNEDRYGVRNPEDVKYEENYAQRQNMIQFAGEADGKSNEVMVKNRIGPEFIRGLVVQDEGAKKELLKTLREADPPVIKVVKGMEHINGKSLDEFVHIASEFTADMWKK